jgi:small-conductance mechanosensitive channel
MPQFLRDIVARIDTEFLRPAIHIGSILILWWVVLKWVDSALSRLRLIIPTSDRMGAARVEQRAETLRSIIRSVGKTVLLFVVIVEIATELKFDIRAVLGTAGIVGLAVGFGAQSFFKDVISGFFILFEDQYGVGDVVKIGDFTGVVERMTLRSTVMRNLEGQVHVVPNGNIQNITVMTRDWARAVLDVTVRYEEELRKIFDALQRVGTRLAQDWPDRVLEQPAILGVEKLDENGVTVRCIVKTPPFKQADVLREWRLRVKEEFDRNGIQFVQKSYVLEKNPSEKAL